MIRCCRPSEVAVGWNAAASRRRYCPVTAYVRSVRAEVPDVHPKLRCLPDVSADFYAGDSKFFSLFRSPPYHITFEVQPSSVKAGFSFFIFY